jgi:hypothetical protein
VSEDKPNNKPFNNWLHGISFPAIESDFADAAPAFNAAGAAPSVRVGLTRRSEGLQATKNDNPIRTGGSTCSEEF